MSRAALPAQRRGVGLGPLLPVFARTRGSWWTGAAAGLAALVIVLLHALTQGLTLSPAQHAQGYFGDFEAARTSAAQYGLGSGPDREAIRGALTRAGATDVGVELYAIDLGRESGADRGEVRYEEQDLASTPTGTVRLESGRVPARAGEACMSPALAERLGSPSSLSYFDGALSLSITCVAVDDQVRDTSAVYAAPGTWAAAGAGLSQDAIRRWGVEGTANVYWSGGDPGEVSAALDAVLPRGAAEDLDTGTGGVETAAEIAERPRGVNAVANVWVFLVPLLLVPLLTAAVTSWGGARLLVRSADTLSALGLRRSLTRRLTVLLPVALTVAGSVVGLAVGAVGGVVLCWLLGVVLPRPVGPWVGLPLVALVVLGMSVLGVLLGSGLAFLRLSPRIRADLAWARRRRVPWPSTPVLLGLMALCAVLAVLAAGDATSTSRRVAAVGLLGLAVVLAVPLVVGLRARRGLAQTPAGLLRSRMVVSAGGAWLIMLLFGAQAVLTTGTVTLLTSGVQTFNASLVSAVPAGQAQLAVLNMDDAGMAGDLVQEVRSELNAEGDFSTRNLEAPTRLADGPVVVVDTPRQAADVLGLPTVPPEMEAALESGSAVRGGGQPAERLVLVDAAAADPALPSAEIADLPVTTVEGAQGMLATGGAVVLSSTAATLPVPATADVAHVFPRLTPEQQERAAQLPEELHFDPDWMDLPKAPDTMPIPETVTWGAAVLSVVGVVLALFYGLQAGAAGRQMLAGARAVGLRQSWARSVLAGQIAWVVLAPTAAGVVGSALGVVAVTTLQGVPMDLHVPWAIVGTMAAGTLLAFTGAAWLALRGMSVRERLA